MDLFDTAASPAPAARAINAPATADLDLALSAQLIVAWAGEGGEDPRLGWWRTDMVSRDGGFDLFRQLLPNTWHWAALQAAREAARRVDEAARRASAEPDRYRSLYALGFDLDERITQRLADLKHAEPDPIKALPILAMTQNDWSFEVFTAWVRNHTAAGSTATGSTAARFTTVPGGRRLAAPTDPNLGVQVSALVACLDPIGETYPLPHWIEAAGPRSR